MDKPKLQLGRWENTDQKRGSLALQKFSGMLENSVSDEWKNKLEIRDCADVCTKGYIRFQGK